jgi:solute carrier family 25 (mitochondrial folate transporter), member 32
MPSMIGLIHVAIQFPLYEKFKFIVAYRSKYSYLLLAVSSNLFLLEKNHAEPLNVKEILWCAIASKLVASSIAYPHEALRSRLQEQSKITGEKKYPTKIVIIWRMILSLNKIPRLSGLCT